MTKKKFFLIVGVLIIIFFATKSLRKASRHIDDYPIHQEYSYNKTAFSHGSIGKVENIKKQLLDSNYVLLYDYKRDIGKQYNPLFIADFALSLVPLKDDEFARQVMFKNLDFLIDTATKTTNGNLLFPYHFDFRIHNEKAPWYSAMAQSRCAQAFIWGYKISQDNRYLQAAKQAIFAIMEKNLDPPLVKKLRRGIWVREYPGYDFEVLDGTLGTLISIYQVYLELDSNDPNRIVIGEFFMEGMQGFKENYFCFKCPFGGVYFSDDRRLPTQGYYNTIMTQLIYLSEIDKDMLTIIAEYSVKDMDFTDRILLYYWDNLNKKILRPMNLIKPCVR